MAPRPRSPSAAKHRGLGRAFGRPQSEAMVPIAQNRSHNAASVFELLCALFPGCFFNDEARRQALKVGIHNDVLLALGDAVTPSELARALQIYVNNRIYQSRLRPGGTRIDLNGEPGGTVTVGEAA